MGRPYTYYWTDLASYFDSRTPELPQRIEKKTLERIYWASWRDKEKKFMLILIRPRILKCNKNLVKYKYFVLEKELDGFRTKTKSYTACPNNINVISFTKISFFLPLTYNDIWLNILWASHLIFKTTQKLCIAILCEHQTREWSRQNLWIMYICKSTKSLRHYTRMCLDFWIFLNWK